MRRRMAAGMLAAVLLLAGCKTTEPQPTAGPDKSRVGSEPSESSDLLLLSIDMVTSQVGWGIGHGHPGLFRTTDGGLSWKSVTPEAISGESDLDLAALSSDQAWLVVTNRDPGSADGYAKVVAYRTTDGGTTWERSEFATAFRSLYGSTVSFLNEREGFVLVEPEHGSHSRPGSLYRTGDAGVNWTLVSALEAVPYAGRLRFGDAQTGWVVGHQVSSTPETLAYTRDGGRTWTEQEQPPPPADLPPGQLSVQQPPLRLGERLVLPATYWPESHKADRFRTLLYTSPGPGEPWELLTHLPNTNTYAFLPSGHGWVWAGAPRDPGTKQPIAGAFQVTQDGGSTWTEVGPDAGMQALLDHGYNVVQLDFTSERTGWALLRASGPHPPRLARTEDGGRSWTELQPRVAP